MAPVEHPKALAELLDEFGWFECGSCTRLSPPPGSAELPERVELVFRDFGTGGLNAGDVRTYQSLRLTASGVHEWSFVGDAFDHAAGHHMDGIEPVETSKGFGLVLDVPTEVRLVADAFEWQRLPEFTEAAAPWTSGDEFFVTAPGAALPSPVRWVEALARHGTEVAWRMYGGPAEPTERVPSGYEGWFLERPTRLCEHDGGVFVASIGEGIDGVDVSMQRNQADDQLWLAMCRSVADMFPGGEFRSGNCQFTADQWRTHLTSTSD